MWHATFTQGNQGDSRLKVIEIKLTIRLSAFLLAITYVLNAQMGHASPF